MAAKPAVKMICRISVPTVVHGGDAEDVDEHGEGHEAAAHAHDGRQDADDETAHGHEDARRSFAAGDQVFVKGDHGRNVHGSGA